MTQGEAHLSFWIDEPYEVGLRMVRIALAEQGARVPAELNVAARIRQQPGACVAPCTVLYVDNPAALLEAVVFDRAAALLIPQPVVVTGDGHHTEVILRSPALAAEIPEGVRGPLFGLRMRILRALDCIGERQGAHLTI